MIHDFNFHQVMRLSSIERWGVVEMSKVQSVAEHSFNVATIALAISDALEASPGDMADIIRWALIHDLPEVVTGDIPSNVKQQEKEIFNILEARLFPSITINKRNQTDFCLRVVKVADYVDAIQFAQKFCVDRRKGAIISEMTQRMDEVILSSGDVQAVIIWSLVAPWLNLKID